MTREEQRTAQIMEIASLRYEDCEKYSAFISGALWADNNPTKDIINLNNIWHDASDKPQDDLVIIYQDKCGDCWFITKHDIVILYINWECFADNVRCWAYISDLLPKEVRNEND